MKKLFYSTFMGVIASATILCTTKTAFAYEVINLENEVKIIQFDDIHEMESYKDSEEYASGEYRKKEVYAGSMSHTNNKKQLIITHPGYYYDEEFDVDDFQYVQLEFSNLTGNQLYLEYYKGGKFNSLKIGPYSDAYVDFDVINDKNHDPDGFFRPKDAYNMQYTVNDQNAYMNMTVKVIELYK